MADETLLDKGELNIPSNLDNLKLYGVNSEQNTDGRVNASLLSQALGGQKGNVPTTNRGDLPNVAFTATDDPQPLIDALNELPLTGVPHGWIGMFSTVRITATSSTSFIADKRFYRFGQPLPGYSNANFTYYGQGSDANPAGNPEDQGALLSTSNMKFFRDEQLIITAENGVITGTGAYDLGDIGTTSVADVVNGSTNTYTESNGVILLTATDGTEQQYYIYNGSENVIGNGGNAVTDDDFTVVDPENSVPAASDVYIMGNQLQNLVIEGVQNEVTSVELLATAFKTESGQVIEGDNILKYFANFEVTSTGIRATLLRRVKLNSQFRPNSLCENATKLDDVQGFITAFGFQDFRGNTNIQEIILPSIRGNSVNTIENNTALTKLVIPKLDVIDTKGCTSLAYLDARGATTLGSLEGCPLTDYLNIDSIKNIFFGNLKGTQRTEVDFFNLTAIEAQDITKDSLIEVFRTPLLESMTGDVFRGDTKIKELKSPNLTEVNKGVTGTSRTFQMTAIELIEAPKCKIFGSDTVSNDMFGVDLSKCKIVVNEHLKTSNNGGINANIQDAIDKGATVVFAKDYAEGSEFYGILNCLDYDIDRTGVNDSSEAIQASLDFAESNNLRFVYIPKGRYKLLKTIYLPSNVEVYGDGKELTSFFMTDETVIDEIKLFPNNTDVWNYYNPLITTKSNPLTEPSKNINLNGFSIEDINYNDAGKFGYVVPLLFNNVKDSTVNVNFGSVETFRGREEGEVRASLGFSLVFCEDINIEKCNHKYAGYESLSIRFRSRNISVLDNVFDIDKPDNLPPQVHAAQVATVLASDLTAVYGADDIDCENITLERPVFYLKNNVHHAFTSHVSKGCKVLNGTVYSTRAGSGIYVYKIFSTSDGSLIRGNRIFLDDGDRYEVPTFEGVIGGVIGLGDYKPQIDTINGVTVSENFIKIKNYTGASMAYNKYASVIGNITDTYTNAIISNNVIEIDSYNDSEFHVIGVNGDNTKVSGNIVNFTNPNNQGSSKVATVLVAGGKNIDVKNNTSNGEQAYGLLTLEGSSIENVYLDGNVFDDCLIDEIYYPYSLADEIKRGVSSRNTKTIVSDNYTIKREDVNLFLYFINDNDVTVNVPEGLLSNSLFKGAQGSSGVLNFVSIGNPTIKVLESNIPKTSNEGALFELLQLNQNNAFLSGDLQENLSTVRLSANEISNDSMNLKFNDTGADSYNIYQDDVLISNVQWDILGHQINNLTADTNYKFNVTPVINSEEVGGSNDLNRKTFTDNWQAVIDRADGLSFTKPVLNVQIAADNLISKSIVNGNYWSSKDRFVNFAYNDVNCEQFSRISWVNPSSDLAVLNGGLTFTEKGFISDGVDGYINTSYNPSVSGVEFLTNDASYGGVQFQGTDSVFLGNDVTTVGPVLMNLNNSINRINTNTSYNQNFDSTGLGLKSINRFSSTEVLQSTRSSFQTDTSTSTNVRNANLCVFRRANSYGANGCSLVFAGGTSNQVEIEQFRIDYNEYLSNIGINPFA